MFAIKQSFFVRYEYIVEFTENLFSISNTLLKDHIIGFRGSGILNNRIKTGILVCIDKEVARSHKGLFSIIATYLHQHLFHHVQLIDNPLYLPGGEKCKNDSSKLELVYGAIKKYNICRHSIIIVIGGGSIIDFVGYCATTAHRGIQLIRIPTTFLSQADASIGVKNSINLLNRKNFLGTFSVPLLICNDYSFLITLPEKILIEGMSEAIKVALIKDPIFFEYIERNTQLIRQRDKKIIQYIIYKCAQLHLNHIEKGGDPFEKGISRPLDFGHWAAHKLEQLSGYTLSHGEAVSIGISLDCMYAFLKGFLQKNAVNRILDLFICLNLPIFSSFFLEREKNALSLLQGLEEFREHLGGELTILLLSDIGKSFEIHKIESEIIQKSIYLLQRYHFKSS